MFMIWNEMEWICICLFDIKDIHKYLMKKNDTV